MDSPSEFLKYAIIFGLYPPNQSHGTVTSVGSGTGLTGGPITSTGTLSFAAIAANSVWANLTGSSAVPTVIGAGSANTASTFVVRDSSGNFSAGTITASLTGHASLDLALTGGTMSGVLSMGMNYVTNTTDPVNPQDVATKNYVDKTALNGTSVYAATTTNLNVTQAGAGVGATLTDASGTFAALSLDSVAIPLGANVLVKNLSISASHLGIYTLTTNGDGISVPYQLTRATSYDTPVEINNTGLIVLQNGATQAGEAWYNAATIVTVDTTAFSYSEFGNIVFPISLAHGGTNANLTASNGGIVYSGASGFGILAGTATAGLLLQSGASGPPSWLATVNSAGLLTNGSGVPGWVAYTGTGAPVLATSPTITTPIISGYNQFLVNTTTVLTTANIGQQVYCTGSTAYAVTLPNVAAMSNMYIDFFVKTTSNALVTITPATSTIQGATTFILGNGESCRIYSDGNDWWVQNLVLQPVYASVFQTTGQSSVATSTYTKLKLDTTTFDIGGFFDTVTNYRYTPLYPGKYEVNASNRFSTGLSTAALQISIYKNGSAASLAAYGINAGNAVQAPSTEVSNIVQMNGSTDYLEIFIWQNSGTNATTAGGGSSYATFKRIGNI